MRDKLFHDMTKITCYLAVVHNCQDYQVQVETESAQQIDSPRNFGAAAIGQDSQHPVRVPDVSSTRRTLCADYPVPGRKTAAPCRYR